MRFGHPGYEILPDQEPLCVQNGTICGHITKECGGFWRKRTEKRLGILTSDGHLYIYKYYLLAAGAGRPMCGRSLNLKEARSVNVSFKEANAEVMIEPHLGTKVSFTVEGEDAALWAAKLFLYSVKAEEKDKNHPTHEAFCCEKTKRLNSISFASKYNKCNKVLGMPGPLLFRPKVCFPSEEKDQKCTGTESYTGNERGKEKEMISMQETQLKSADTQNGVTTPSESRRSPYDMDTTQSNHVKTIVSQIESLNNSLLNQSLVTPQKPSRSYKEEKCGQKNTEAENNAARVPAGRSFSEISMEATQYTDGLNKDDSPRT